MLSSPKCIFSLLNMLKLVNFFNFPRWVIFARWTIRDKRAIIRSIQIGSLHVTSLTATLKYLYHYPLFCFNTCNPCKIIVIHILGLFFPILMFFILLTAKYLSSHAFRLSFIPSTEGINVVSPDVVDAPEKHRRWQP